MRNKVFTTSEAARICHVERATIIRWIDVGILKAFKTPTGRNKIICEDLVDLLKKNGMPIPPELKELAKPLIYIVDDEADFLYIIRERLLGAGESTQFDLTTFDSAFDALMAIGKNPPDVLLTDIRMPGMSGYELCRKLRESDDTAAIRIVIISGYLDEDVERFKKDKLADAYFEKPIDFKELRKLLTAYTGVEF
jgi:CheY-like chemotaxis protein